MRAAYRCVLAAVILVATVWFVDSWRLRELTVRTHVDTRINVVSPDETRVSLQLLTKYPYGSIRDNDEVPGLPGSRGYLVPVQGPGRCLNPHPGPFRAWNGQQNGCFVQVWRQFQDGCTHYEWFNACANQWDPTIYWTYCVH
jgi:hypothetical protein